MGSATGCRVIATVQMSHRQVMRALLARHTVRGWALGRMRTDLMCARQYILDGSPLADLSESGAVWIEWCRANRFDSYRDVTDEVIAALG